MKSSHLNVAFKKSSSLSAILEVPSRSVRSISASTPKVNTMEASTRLNTSNLFVAPVLTFSSQVKETMPSVFFRLVNPMGIKATSCDYPHQTPPLGLRTYALVHLRKSHC
ncbi:hypothetical protein ACEPPN_001722 [Leptodophora sp. 'Broadleaf-Isolate-01']